jgi:hypothetical protein
VTECSRNKYRSFPPEVGRIYVRALGVKRSDLFAEPLMAAGRSKNSLLPPQEHQSHSTAKDQGYYQRAVGIAMLPTKRSCLLPALLHRPIQASRTSPRPSLSLILRYSSVVVVVEGGELTERRAGTKMTRTRRL